MNLYDINTDINNNYVNYIGYNNNYVVYHIINDNKKQQFFLLFNYNKNEIKEIFLDYNKDYIFSQINLNNKYNNKYKMIDNNFIVYIEEDNKYRYINKINLLSQKLETIDSMEKEESNIDSFIKLNDDLVLINLVKDDKSNTYIYNLNQNTLYKKLDDINIVSNIHTPYFNKKYNILIFNRTFLEYSEVIDSIKRKEYFQPNDIIYLDLSNNKIEINSILYPEEGTFYNILDCTDKYLFILSINKNKKSKIIKYNIEKREFIDLYAIDEIFDQIIIGEDILYFIQYRKNIIELLINDVKQKMNYNRNIIVNNFDKIIEILDNNNIILIKGEQEDIKNYSHFMLEKNRILFDILYVKNIGI